MPNNNAKGQREINSAVRKEDGEIIGFQLKDHHFIDYQTALSEAKKGKLVGINLYPDFVKAVTGEGEQIGLLKRLVKFFSGK